MLRRDFKHLIDDLIGKCVLEELTERGLCAWLCNLAAPNWLTQSRPGSFLRDCVG